MVGAHTGNYNMQGVLCVKYRAGMGKLRRVHSNESKLVSSIRVSCLLHDFAGENVFARRCIVGHHRDSANIKKYFEITHHDIKQ